MRLAWRNLIQDKLRALLSVVGVALAIMLILILAGFVSGKTTLLLMLGAKMTVHIGSNALISAGTIVLLASAAVVSGWIALSQLLWFGLVLTCPLMMLLRMRGGMHHGGEPDRRDVEVKEPSRR